MNTRTVARRGFLLRAGASLSGPLAVAVAAAAPGSGERATRDSSADAEAIRELQRAYAAHLNAGEYESLLRLFSPDARVHFDGGVFVGRERGIRRLYARHFFDRNAPQPVHVLLLGHPQAADRLQLSADGGSATARFHCLTHAQARIASGLPLIEMARQQGQGIIEWCEAGCFDTAYLQAGGRWRIDELRYRTLGAAPALIERARGRPDFVPGFSRLYPEDAIGPDRLDRT